jgi:GAF domain-containing protein
MEAKAHPKQTGRLAALRSYGILDTPREESFDDIAELAAQICGTPIAVVNLIDAERQWFKAEVGLGTRETPLETSICSHVILEQDFTMIEDTQRDPRTADNELCLPADGLRFYAGALLKAENDLPIGTLCVLDNKPNRLSDQQIRALHILARRVMSELNLKRAMRAQDLLRDEMDHRVKNSLATVRPRSISIARRLRGPAIRMQHSRRSGGISMRFHQCTGHSTKRVVRRPLILISISMALPSS